MDGDLEALLRSRIRSVPDFPEPGIDFKDITPLLADHRAMAAAVEAIVAHYAARPITKVVGIEARGFILAAPVAYRAGAGFVPVRKAGKLPSAAYSVNYELEYAEATLEVHQDAFEAGDRILLVDDVLATGGTLAAAASLIEQAGGTVDGCSVLLEIAALGGRERASGLDIHTLLTY